MFAVLLRFFLFENHVAVFDGVEDLSTELAFDKFGVFVARDSAYLRMPALLESGLERRNERIFTRHGSAVNGDSTNFYGRCGFRHGGDFGERGRRSALGGEIPVAAEVEGNWVEEVGGCAREGLAVHFM